MLTCLHTQETIIYHIFKLMAEKFNISLEEVEGLFYTISGKKFNRFFWYFLDKEYPGHKFKKIKFCADSGKCELG